MSRANVEVVRAWFDAYRRQDTEAAVKIADPEIEVRPSIVGGLEGNAYRGLDGFRQFLADIEEAWADFRIDVEEFRDLDDTVLVLGRISGRGEGSGILIEAGAGWVCVVHHGKMRRLTTFTSKNEALQAVGLSE